MPEEEKKEKKGPPKVLFLGVGAVAFLIVAAGISYYVATTVKPAKIHFEKERPPQKPKPPKPYRKHEVGDFTWKLKDPLEDRFAKIEGLYLAFDEVKYKELAPELAKRDAQIRDVINTILLHQTSEIYSKEGKYALKEEIKRAVNDMLIDGKIADVYFVLIVQ